MVRIGYFNFVMPSSSSLSGMFIVLVPPFELHLVLHTSGSYAQPRCVGTKLNLYNAFKVLTITKVLKNNLIC